jgi:hypothetical protein
MESLSVFSLPSFEAIGFEFLIRSSNEADIGYAQRMCELIEEASLTSDIARRSVDELAGKIRDGLAVLAFRVDCEVPELVGGAYISEYDRGEFVTHSALIVSEKLRGSGAKLGKRIKSLLMEMTSVKFPGAKIFSLTTNPCVIKLNISHGFQEASFEDGPHDEAFWAGCYGCRKFSCLPKDSKRRCCCSGYLWTPPVK